MSTALFCPHCRRSCPPMCRGSGARLAFPAQRWATILGDVEGSTVDFLHPGRRRRSDLRPSSERRGHDRVYAGPAAAEGPARYWPLPAPPEDRRGGMGAVYLAEQETPVRRRVAIKIIKPGMDPSGHRPVRGRTPGPGADGPSQYRQGVGRRRDRRRPPVLRDGAGQGRPDHRLLRPEHDSTLRERLELFVPVCQAIQHAHQKGIIHRDIKPSNVLVTLHDGKPAAKVIDFGVAKAIDQS